jgi:hypothetical protein
LRLDSFRTLEFGFIYQKELMMKKLFITILAVSTILSTPVFAQNFSAEITNLTSGIHFTPLIVSAHPSTTHIFQVSTSASVNLQAMAEGGDTSGLAADLMSVSADIVDNPAGGFLAPGASTTANFTNTDTANTSLSIVAMLLPTNDGFVGMDSLKLPTSSGTYTYYLNAYDAGTEQNNEVINGGGTPGTLGIPADPGANNGVGATGITAVEASNVHIHRGVIGDTDLNGGVSDLDSRVHRWLNPVAKLVITIN